MWVVWLTPLRLWAGSSSASSAASTTGKCSGRQPPITALMASFSTVAGPPLGGTGPEALLRVAARRPRSCASTRRRVGSTTGSPSVQFR